MFIRNVIQFTETLFQRTFIIIFYFLFFIIIIFFTYVGVMYLCIICVLVYALIFHYKTLDTSFTLTRGLKLFYTAIQSYVASTGGTVSFLYVSGPMRQNETVHILEMFGQIFLIRK